MSRKFIKKFKKRVPWLSNISTLEPLVELMPTHAREETSSNMCLICRGTKLLCGKSRCPIIAKLYSYRAVEPLIKSRDIHGSSPPAIFIGRFNYPLVSIGPLIPPFHGDTSIMDRPEQWHDLSVDEIIKMRFSLIRGKKRVHVRDAVKDHKIIAYIQELALARYSAESDMILKREPRGALIDSRSQPIGPSAPLEKLEVYSIKSNQLMEKIYEDDDLKAVHGILKLYENGLDVSTIVRGFSAGLFGLKQERRFVPTRWSITAVDSVLSNKFISEIKRNPVIDSFYIYEANFLGDRFVVILFPEKWSYEFIEAWFPGTTWNPDKYNVAIGGDWEPYWGRSNYAQIGGCYYAARLAVTEHLRRIKKQAKVLILRESYPEHILPLGVWHVREGVRLALKSRPIRISEFKDVLSYISGRLRVPINTWLDVSRLLRDQLSQTKITRWIKQY